MKKPIYKRWWAIVLGGLLLLMVIGAALSGETPTERAEREIAKLQDEKEQSKEVIKKEKQVEKQDEKEEVQEQEEKIISPSDVQWNTEDLNVIDNGNAIKAAQVLNKMESKDFEAHTALISDIQTVTKAPWKYYGQFVQIDAYVVMIQAYPPNSDVSKSLANGKECTEIVVSDEYGSNFLNFYLIGDATDFDEGEEITIIGLPCGLIEYENRLGGMTTSLVMVGR